jgi:hypothetical protein
MEDAGKEDWSEQLQKKTVRTGSISTRKDQCR